MKGFLDSTLTFYRDMKKQKVVTRSNPAFGKAQDSSFEMDLPPAGRPAEEVFEEIKDICSAGALVQHPRCFACVPSPVSPYSWMGDLMTNAFDHHAGCWRTRRAPDSSSAGSSNGWAALPVIRRPAEASSFPEAPWQT